ncbi:hypothetical protein A3A60_02285 [Candidatus Curtissbacteria bacterium RIFCSPLOWO2_01_FULL_42_26]|uniref:Dockerin domain-containing protein n=1 Tax=Candidatus Curtissbacteria bacterium RIFCSPLOWO2_01_FULL_42_26 TaxID=1797729 RepID=A0A1F5I2R8_9BACT|nr:MAG: hypothetical protein A3A60_02285 [Candidatus Curtissbacteria bacterium RIFCSPLOWO2_01_FULL_42_26]
MIIRKGVVQIGLIVLALVGLAFATSLSVSARYTTVGRPFGNFRERLCIANPGSIFCKGKINTSPRSTPSPSLPPSVEKGPCYPIGDVNGNGVVNASDAEAILHYIAGTKSIDPYKDRADVNKDGAITSVDAQLIRQYLAGSIKTFAACSSSPNPSSVVLKSISPSSANIGIVITLSGSGFGPVKGEVIVYDQNEVNNRPATISTWTATMIKAKVPAVAGHRKYKIEVVTSSGLRSNRLEFEILGGLPFIFSIIAPGTADLPYPGGFIRITGEDFGSTIGSVNIHDSSGKKVAQCIFLYFAVWTESKIDCGLPDNLKGGTQYGLQVITSDNRQSSFSYFRTR